MFRVKGSFGLRTTTSSHCFQPYKTPTTIQEDSEDWLNLTAAQLDSLLSAKFGTAPNPSSKDKATQASDESAAAAEAQNLEEVVKGLQSFIDTKTSHEGAEFLEDLSDEVDSDSDNDDSISNPSSNPTDAVSFDVGNFMGLMSSLMGLSEADFEEHPSKAAPAPASGDVHTEATGETIADAANAMEEELTTDSRVREGFERTEMASDDKPEDSRPAPIDLDLNLVKNILDSYSAQEVCGQIPFIRSKFTDHA